MSPQVGFDEAVAARARARVGARTRLYDAMNGNAVRLDACVAHLGAPAAVLLGFGQPPRGERLRVGGWIERHARAERELRL